MTAADVTLRALAEMARCLAGLAEELAASIAAAEPASPTDPVMLPEREAARIAGVSLGVLRRARREGALTFYGGQRSRSVKRSDLVAWIETRRAPIARDVLSSDDADIESRVRRLSSASAARR